jgi:integrase
MSEQMFANPSFLAPTRPLQIQPSYTSMSRSSVQPITTTAVKRLAPGDEIRDPVLKGFGSRRQVDAVTYFVQARIRGRKKRITIGQHGPWTAEKASKEASRILVAISAGDDPAQAREDRKRVSATFEQVAQDFLALHGPKIKPSSRSSYTIHIQNRLGASFNGRPIKEISLADISRAHASWAETPRAANYALAVLSKLLTWSEKHGYRDKGTNPCGEIDRYPEVKRKRYLTTDEMARLGEVLHQAEMSGENPWIVNIFRLLLLTGARLGEMLSLRWEYVDVSRRALHLPDSKTGAKTIPLSPAALSLLQSLPRLDRSPWVFPSHIPGAHITAVHHNWTRIRDRAGLSDVHIHDLRHSYASAAITAGGSLPLVGHLLGHAQPITTQRYAHIAPSPAQHLADMTGNTIADALSRNIAKVRDGR